VNHFEHLDLRVRVRTNIIEGFSAGFAALFVGRPTVQIVCHAHATPTASGSSPSGALDFY
jgi:hypothetical protein